MVILHQKKGYYAEKSFINALLNRNHQVLHHRYQSSYGEIDIISKKERCIYFFEIKYRSKKPEQLSTVIKYQQIQRIYQSAEKFIACNYNNIIYQYKLFLSIITPKQVSLIPL
ncbi:MAG: hypothetical protein P857_268 [Candidatus Xenolissoclinum pacificiensis L6]|uniref:Uncharacterized protein n=1 Tax=Candidatus Xenolissoclinum pacificiensis L6 TaxID=1401685 RepID=W2V129_9RICK|nr:MAG: hypothetical protein P857_268 [Candidatus Xenolissoclinum pacificiensis L6]